MFENYIPSETKSFTVTSGILRVTDPCYDLDVWCAGQLNDVKTGKWIAHAGYYKDEAEVFSGNLEDHPPYIREQIKNYRGRVAYLYIVHEDNQHTPFDKSLYQEQSFEVGVDSGQAGFFDLDFFSTGKQKDKEAKEELEIDMANGNKEFERTCEFYDEIMELTSSGNGLGMNGWGVNDFCAVSSSGYGDGGYPCYALRDKEGKLISAFIQYLFENEDEYFEEEE